MPMVPLDLIREDPAQDVRRHRASTADDAALRASIESLGMLQPVLLRLDGNADYVVIAGRRRVAQARAIGLAQIPAHIDNNFPEKHELAAAAAENMVRAGLEPLDQWRAMADLRDGGYTLAQAAAALGLSDRRARQLDKLGRLHPDVIAAIEADGMPDDDQLGNIASAPPAIQVAALGRIAKNERDPHWRWSHVASSCATGRVPQNRAIFDVNVANVVFEEDLFAAPGSSEAMFTADIPGFMTAQRGALEDRVAAFVKRGRKVQIATWKKGAMVIPKGWTETYGTVEKPPRGATLFTCVAGDGYSIGTIVGRFAMPAQTKAKGKPEAADDDAADDDAADDDVADDAGDEDESKAKPAARPKPAAPNAPAPDIEEKIVADTEARVITAAGRDLIARAKTEAVRKHLLERAESLDPSSVLAYLVLALGSASVSVTDPNLMGARIRLSAYAAELVPPEGAASLQRGAAKDIAVRLLAEMLVVPDSRREPEPTVEWIGQHCGADSALPRFDTPAFLLTVSGAELKRAAIAAGLKPAKTVPGLRTQLAGALPAWKPPGAEFGAPGPVPAKR